jgi:hypothetical protein
MLGATVPSMSDIDVSCTTAADGWLCEVTIASHWNESRHSVAMTRADFQRLAASGETPENLVRRSIKFLLERESKEAILPSFELMDIGRYFPEFEGEIRSDREAGAGT